MPHKIIRLHLGRGGGGGGGGGQASRPDIARGSLHLAHYHKFNACMHLGHRCCNQEEEFSPVCSHFTVQRGSSI